MHSLVIFVFLYVCESGTFTTELEQRKAGLSDEMQLNIVYKEHVTNKDVHRKIQAAIEEYAELFCPG